MASSDPETIALERLNALPAAAFATALSGVFEHAPWVAEKAAAARPFATVTALHEALTAAVRTEPDEVRVGFLRQHPELGSKVARTDLTRDSQAEQGSLGLDRLSDEEFSRFRRLNAAYREKFGFPFIICVRRHTRDSILRRFETRLANDRLEEMRAALAEIGLITRLRLVARVSGAGVPKTTGRLSTHVLDLSRGKPAAGLRVTLHEIGASARGLVAEAVTNADGPTDQPLIAGEPLRIGTYELQFSVGDYFAGTNRFLDIVPLRFSIAEPEGHYHVPLLVTPFSYTAYRGS